MLTDDDRNHLLSIADTVASLHAVDVDHRRGHCLAAAERIRAIAAPRVAPSPTPGICAAIEQAAAWIELGEIGATPDGEALVATLRGFTRAPRVATVARPIAEWHEDHGPALWWQFPVDEPPYSGSPLDDDWPGYHTHWTPIVCPDADAIRAAIAADKARAVEAASDAAFDRGRAATIKYADGLVMRPVLSREDADALIDALGRGVRDLWRSAHNTPERSKALDDHDTARTALIAALTGAPMSDATSRFDNACPHDGCGGEMEGGEFSDGSENNCTKCGKVAVCAEYEGGTFGWRAYDPEEPDDDDAALTGAGGGS